MDWTFLHKYLLLLSLWDIIALAINLLLILFARPLVRNISSASLPEKSLKLRINLLRGLNFIFLVVYSYDNLYRAAGGSGTGITIISILAILYTANISNFLMQYFIHRHYGKQREYSGTTHYIETYKSRLLSILAAIFISLVAVISIIHQMGFDSLLEAGGVLGVIGVVLGLTQGSWAPDIISGLIILNSDMFEEGDIVEFEDGTVGRVYKTKLFHTEVLNIVNNHRIMIRNAMLRDKIIHNLSKYASIHGLRECLTFNIGYDVSTDAVKKMFAEAYDDALDHQIPIEPQSCPEIKVLETGDHAIKWGIIFHVKKVEQIVNIRREFRETILKKSEEKGISLATPITHAAFER